MDIIKDKEINNGNDSDNKYDNDGFSDGANDDEENKVI